MRHQEYSRPGELACFIGGEQGPQPMQTKLTRSLFLHYLFDDMVMSLRPLFLTITFSMEKAELVVIWEELVEKAHL